MSRKRQPQASAAAPNTCLADSKNAIGIVRVSTVKQSDGNSPDVQQAGIEAYARRNGLKLLEVRRVYESGKDSEARPLYRSAMDEALRCGNVIFWVWDRTGRNLTDHEQLEKDVKAGRLTVHIAHEGRAFDRRTPDGDWLVADISKVTAKQYSRELRRRCLEGMVAKAESGGYPTKPPLGYVIRRDIGPDGEAKQRGGTIVKQPWCDALLHRMRELRVAGQSFRLIADQVIEEGLVPENKRRGFTRPSRAGWVENLLKNPFYAGYFFWRDVRYPARHEPVFSAAQWAELQTASDGKPAPLRTAKRDAALAGFLKCAQCGCQITYDPKSRDGRVYHYYRCANGKKQHSKLIYVTQESIMRGFASAAESIAIDVVIADELTRILNESHATTRAERRRESAKFQRELEDIDVDENKLFDLLSSGVTDEASYKRQLQRIRDRRGEATRKLAKANEDLDDAQLDTLRSTLELAKSAKITWATRSVAEQRRFLEIVVSNVRLDGQTVRYDLRKPFQILSELREDPTWRTREDSNFRPSDS